MARLGMIELDQLPPMQVLETLAIEGLLSARMAEFVARWKTYDPPAGAEYDVSALEFDPIKILQEANTFFELLLRDRVNQAAKSVTLAFASGSDLDAIASRYPGGMPRLSGESDDHYRTRIWLSVNTLSPHGTYESYVFWVLTVAPELRDATATAVRGTPNVTITIMADGDPVTASRSIDGVYSLSAFPSPTPTKLQIDDVQAYVLDDSRKALTDVVSVRAPRIILVDYSIRYWLFPGWSLDSLEAQLWKTMADIVEKQRWLGYSHVKAAVEGLLKIPGVFNVKVDSPAEDVIVLQHEVVVVNSCKLVYAGRGGFEPPPEP